MGYYKEFYWSETVVRGVWLRRGYDLIKVFQRLCVEEGSVRRWAQVLAGGDQAVGRVRFWYVLKVELSGFVNGLFVDVREVGVCLGEGEGFRFRSVDFLFLVFLVILRNEVFRGQDLFFIRCLFMFRVDVGWGFWRLLDRVGTQRSFFFQRVFWWRRLWLEREVGKEV